MSNHQFDIAKWQKMDIFNQMGNIGSEVGRALQAKESGRQQDMEAAFQRGLDLFDATLDAPSVAFPGRKREVTRAREQFTQVITTDARNEGLEQYFMEFATAARMRQCR